jgi:hypothetical protein
MIIDFAAILLRPQVELFPEGASKPPLCRYTVIVHTSDTR